MQTYKIKLKIVSGTLTPFQADTLFGHLCWVIVHQGGERGLRDFLEAFKQGSPPFIISNGFSGDFLPKPLSADFLTMEPDKDIKKRIWVERDDFDRIRHGERFVLSKSIEGGFKSVSSTHSRISRISNTTTENSLYALEETIADPYVSIYLKVISDEWKDKVICWLTELSKSGYGRKKSIGKGQFSVSDDVTPHQFDEIRNANGFVTLSNFCPAENDPTEGLYKTFVKYGKLGEEFTFCGNPFKKPLLMIKAGSVFKTDGKPKEYYGRMVDKIAPAKESEVVHYGYAFAVSIKYPELKQR